MSIYTMYKGHLKPVNGLKIDLERHIQSLTEKNLEIIFNLTFVSGSLNSEFHVSVNEQEFYIDTLAFDEENKSFVIIEYKKDRSFSVIDQGFAYLSALLNRKADFVLEINERLDRSYKLKDIDWDITKVIFISPEFTNYQKNAINFKDMPLYLYEVALYENNIIEYRPIKAYNTTASVKKIIKDPKVSKVTSEIKVYDVSDLIKEEWDDTKLTFDQLRVHIMNFDSNIKESISKTYIAYKKFKNGQWLNFAEICPQKSGLKIYLDVEKAKLRDVYGVASDVSSIGHNGTGNIEVKIDNKEEDVIKAAELIKQSYLSK